MSTIAALIDGRFKGQSPYKIVSQTIAAILLSQVTIGLLRRGHLLKRLDAFKWSIIRVVFASIVKSKVADAAKSFTYPSMKDEKKYIELPLASKSTADIIQEAALLHGALDVDYQKGTLSGAVYHGGDAHTVLINRVMEIYQWTNPLHVDMFGAVRKMEAEVVQMVVNLYNGHAQPGACGALTSGGTESIGMAIKSYRDWAYSRGIEKPSIICPITAHPAFDKGCSYYGVELIKLPVDAQFRVNPRDVARAIRYDTIAIVGSGPSFPHGTVDPIAELSEIAFERGIGLHVDCCLGSFIMPFLKKAGFEEQVVDFRLRGVTSISCDTHKYGFAPKGTSVIMYSTRELRQFQFFGTADFPGGIYASPGASGSRAGNVIAGTWAAMLSLGEEGYIKSCRDIVSARIKMTDAIKSLPYLYIIGDPVASVFGFGSNVIDVYVFSSEMKERGWALNSLQFPAGLQFSVTLLQAQEGVAERFVKDVTEIGNRLHAEVLAAAKDGRKVAVGSEGATVYGSQQRISDRTIINSVTKVYLEGYYATNH